MSCMADMQLLFPRHHLTWGMVSSFFSMYETCNWFWYRTSQVAASNIRAFFPVPVVLFDSEMLRGLV